MVTMSLLDPDAAAHAGSDSWRLLEDLVQLVVPLPGADGGESVLTCGWPADLVPFRHGRPEPAVQGHRGGVANRCPAQFGTPAATGELWSDPDRHIDDIVVLRCAR